MVKNNYIFRGHFYNVKIGEKLYNCRQQLIITEKGTDYNSLFDMVVVMMNPGSSRPLDDNYIIKTYDSFSKFIDSCELVNAHPDNTQYQICKLMSKMGFSNTLIINLSDLREPNSNKFYEQLNNNLSHSIFHKSRLKELNKLLSKKKDNAPLVLGWGVSRKLEPLTTLYSLSSIENNFNTIARKEKDHLKYYHPLPRIYSKQIEWINEIVMFLKSA